MEFRDRSHFPQKWNLRPVPKFQNKKKNKDISSKNSINYSKKENLCCFLSKKLLQIIIFIDMI